MLASAPLHSIHASLGPRIQLDVITDTGVSGLWILGGIRVGRQCSQGNFFSFPWPAPGMVHGFQRSGQVRLDELEEPHSQGSASWGVVTHSQQHFPKGTPSSQLPPGSRCQGPGLAAALPGQSCCRKVYVATSRAAELERPPPRGMSLAMTALKPGTGPPAGREGRRGP